MKKLLLPVFILITFSANAQSWVNVGSPGFSDTSAWSTSIAIDKSGTPYVAFANYYTATNNWGPASVMKYNGSNWVYVGSPGFSIVSAASPSLTIDTGGTPYVVYGYGDSARASVMKFDGSSWVYVGSPEFSEWQAAFTSIAIDGSGTPYVAYSNSGVGYGFNATVMKYNGSNWDTVGYTGFSDSVANFTSLAIDGGGTPYVAYQDFGYNYKATVMKYNGSSWVTVGNPGFSSGTANSTMIAIDTGGTPYVVYEDDGNSSKATVMRYNGSSWVSVGVAGFTPGAAYNPMIAIDGSGTPYVAFADGNDSEKATVMKYNGSNWAVVGSSDFSAKQAGTMAIAINAIGTPYVAYQDYSTSNYAATVMRCGSPAEVSNVNEPITSLNLFPDPNRGSFTLDISSTMKENVTIIITNILGEKVKELTTTTNTDTQIKMDSPPGIYFISAVMGSGVVSGKVEVW